jgi:Flp pilus assembly protein TadB
VSRERARARAAREQEGARRAERARAEAARQADRIARRRRRDLSWRQRRLWSHGPAFRRHKERWAALATLVLVALLLTYLLTSSLTAVALVGLVGVIGAPALVAVFFDRNRR